MKHLVELAELPKVTIQIVPFAAGFHPGMKGPFKIIEFDDTPDENILFLEGPREDFIGDDPEEVTRYLETFERIGGWRSHHRILLSFCARLLGRWPDWHSSRVLPVCSRRSWTC